MNKFTKEKKDLIATVSINFKDKKISIFDGIYGKAFEGFKRVLLKKGISIDDKEIVLFRDFTWFGSGDEGLLITSEYLYFKFWWYFEQVKIKDVHAVKIGGWFNENIEFIFKNEATVSIWAYEVFDEVKAVVDILKKEDEAQVEQIPKQIQCRGCKAIIRASQNFCEYCRSPVL